MVGQPKKLLDALDQRKNHLLLISEAALPHSQFVAFRKIFLNELGRSGFQRELEDAFRVHHGKVRNGQAPKTQPE